MFGLGNYSATAQAVVQDARLLNYRSVNEHNGGTYELILDVQPAEGEVFRATTRFHLAGALRMPMAGSIVNVKYDPKTRKVKLELKGDPRYDLSVLAQTVQDEQHEQREHLLSSAPGTPAPTSQRSQEILEQIMKSYQKPPR